MSRPITALIAAAAAAGAIASWAPAASAQNVSEVAVTGRAPTTVRISIAHKTHDVVRQEVRTASGVVCKNAVSNRELAFADERWCARATATKAMRRYADIVSRRPGLAQAGATIVLSSR